MKVFRCGLNVITRNGSIKAIITGINIRYERVNYEISYFFDGIYKSVWLDQDEFHVIAKQKDVYLTIGFKGNGDK
jgi:effector-binding domain-containing protein